MANFPIYQPRGTTSGVTPSAPANLTIPETGGQYRAMRGAGRELAGLGQQMYRAQGEVELARAQNADAQTMNEFFLGLEKNTDPQTYMEEYRKTLADIENREVKNGWAKRRRKIALDRAKPEWEMEVGKAALARTTDNLMSELARKEAWAI